MTEPSAAVKEKLARATARRAAEMGVPGGAMPEPPAPQQQTLKQPTLPETESASPNGSPAAGSGTAKYLLVDHYFGGSNGTFWTYDGTTWRGAGTAEPTDEQGIAQVAFAANKVDMSWDANDRLTLVRCWKYL